jgi:hypothetical protein
MSAHTPAPWTLRKSDAARPESRRVDIVTAFGEFAPAFIAGDALPEDARLISAAPDLLVALRFLLADYVAIEGEKLTGSTIPIEMAREAIAKAEGGGMNLPASHEDSPDHAAYCARVEALEAEGLTTSDSQAVADLEFPTPRQ